MVTQNTLCTCEGNSFLKRNKITNLRHILNELNKCPKQLNLPI